MRREARGGAGGDRFGLLIPGSHFSISVRNAAMRLFPLLVRLGIGFGKNIEAVSRAIELPA